MLLCSQCSDADECTEVGFISLGFKGVGDNRRGFASHLK